MKPTVHNNQQVLRVGLDFAAPVPLHTDLKSEKFEGYEVDILNAISKDLKMELAFTVSYWKNIIAGVVNNELDIICSAATVSVERKQVVNFSNPYLYFHLAIVSRIEQPVPLDQLEIVRIGVRAGTEAEKWLIENCSGKPVEIFDTNDEQYNALVTGKIDAIIDDSPIAFGFTSDSSSIVISQLLPGTLSQYAMIINKRKPVLLEKIDRVIGELDQSGFLAESRRRWFGTMEL